MEGVEVLQQIGDPQLGTEGLHLHRSSATITQ